MTESESMLLVTYQTAHPTFLVVATDPKFLKFLDMSLKLEFECIVLAVTSGWDAVKKAEQIKPDLFMLDYHLLDSNALVLSHRLHTIRELASIPTIFLNSPGPSWSDPQMDNTVFLSMSFSLAELYTAVYKSLDRA